MRTVPTVAVLALHGGTPVRANPLPYGHQSIGEDDIRAVVEVLRSEWITTGPKVAEFEEAFATYVGSRYAVSFSSGTAALHGAAFAAGLEPGDEAVTSPLTFCATANCVIYQGATPMFADVDPGTLCVDPDAVASVLTSRTKAVLPVDYAGHPAALDAIGALADRHGLVTIEDASHALGASYRGRRVGGVSRLTVFSFHPVKHITTGEGGMVTTDDAGLARRLQVFRGHGIETDFKTREAEGHWYYEMVELGYNYRLSDIACALGRSQLRRLDANLARRREIAARYTLALRHVHGVETPSVHADVVPAWHLYPVRLRLEQFSTGRAEIFRALRAEGVGVNVHYIPVHLHPYYRHRFGFKGGEYPVAEAAYEGLLSLPMFHGMTDADVDDVIVALRKVVQHYAADGRPS